MTATIQTFLNNAQTAVGGVFVISCLMITAYIFMLRQMSGHPTFQAHFVSISALMIVMPALLFLAVTATIGKDVVASLLGVIVGYFFQKRDS